MDTIYTEWSCMAAALTAGMTLMLVLRRAPVSFRLFVSHRSHLGQAWRICFTWSSEPGLSVFPAPQQERGGNAGLYDCFCADWNGFL